MTVNKVILVGNLGADPESRSTQSGSTIAKLRVATTERAKDRASVVGVALAAGDGSGMRARQQAAAQQ